jgi:hypothetical protein
MLTAVLIGLVVLAPIAVVAFASASRPSPVEGRYRLTAERRLAQRRINALVDGAMIRLLDEARRHQR